MTETKQMEKIFKLSVEEVEKVLSGKTPITERTRLSVASLGVYSRLKSAEVHERAIEIALQKYKAISR